MSDVARTGSPPPRANTLRHFYRYGCALLVMVSAAALATWATSPFPGANEPHYWCKARHWWDARWLSGDFFLESLSAHQVFYATLGSLTRVLPLAECAMVARVLGWASLACGWLAASRWLLPAVERRAAAFVAFCGCQTLGHFSGEWVIGPSEAKVFAYAALLAAYGMQSCPALSGLSAGLAISLHPVAAGWAVLAAVAATGITVRVEWSRIVAWRWGLLLMVLGALPGCWAALPVLQSNAPAEIRLAADQVQVFFRLGHHLNPKLIPPQAWVGYAVLLGGLVVCGVRHIEPSDDSRQERRWWLALVAAALGIGGLGLVASWGLRPDDATAWASWRLRWLKLYPFRLFDVATPAVASLLLIDAASQRMAAGWPMRLAGLTLLAATMAAGVWQHAVLPPRYPEAAAPWRDPWREVCAWVATHTAEDVLCGTPPSNCDFKWWAGRKEYVSFKDCPQDAAGIVEWTKRMRRYERRWKDYEADGEITRDELLGWRRETGIDVLVTERVDEIAMESDFRNELYGVYDLTVLER